MTFAELLAHPEVVEELTLRDHGLGFLALHGGLESGTGELARAAARNAGSSCYVVEQPRSLRNHVPSVAADPESAPRLAAFLDAVHVVVSVHGYWSRRAELDHAILVGGARRDLVAIAAARLRTALPDVSVRCEPAEIPPDLRGLDPRNPVNRARGGGVQLELPPRVRVLGVVARRPHLAPYRAQTLTLVDTLAALARELAS